MAKKKKKGTKKVKPSDYYIPESIERKGDMNLGKKFPPQAFNPFDEMVTNDARGKSL